MDISSKYGAFASLGLTLNGISVSYTHLSFVPDEIVQRMRQYNRRIFDLNKEKVYQLTKLDALLQRCNIRISNYVSSTDSKSYTDVVKLLSEGIVNAAKLTEAIHGRTVNRVGKEVITAALTGVVNEVDLSLIHI